MKNHVRVMLAEVVKECGEVLASNKGRYRKFPVELKHKVFRLQQLGISAKELAQALELPLVTIYSWCKKASRPKVVGLASPKRLRLKATQSDLPETYSESQRVECGRILFRSGVYLELPVQQIDGRILNFLHELGH